MTKLAIKRRQNIRAMRTLIRKYGYEPDRFEIEEQRRSYRLAGSPVLWTCDYWGECDETEPIRELRHIQFCEKTDWDRLAKEDEIRRRYA